MAIGGDQGGSIRMPAAACGIVGLKPTFGLVPYTGISSSELTIDHTGPMARSVYDTALMLEVWLLRGNSRKYFFQGLTWELLLISCSFRSFCYYLFPSQLPVLSLKWCLIWFSPSCLWTLVRWYYKLDLGKTTKLRETWNNVRLVLSTFLKQHKFTENDVSYIVRKPVVHKPRPSTTLNICSLSSLSYYKFLAYCIIIIIIFLYSWLMENKLKMKKCIMYKLPGARTTDQACAETRRHHRCLPELTEV